MLKYRGKRAHAHVDARRDASGKVWIKLPPAASECGTLLLEVVSSFRHVGSCSHVSAQGHTDAHDKAALCAKSYAKLAGPAFSAAKFETRTRISLAASLLWSRLLNCVHVWSSPQPRPLKTLEAAHMRPAGRIANQSRFSTSNGYTDLEVRQQLQQPSVESAIRQKRPTHLRRVLCHAPRCSRPCSSTARLLATEPHGPSSSEPHGPSSSLTIFGKSKPSYHASLLICSTPSRTSSLGMC